MEPAIYRTCFPDIFEQIVGYLDVSDVAKIALTSSCFARYVRQTGLLYRHISIPAWPDKRKQCETLDEDVRRLCLCLRRSTLNAYSVTSLSIRHRFSGYMPSEEAHYVEIIAEITKQCPNLSSLSLNLSNFASSYYLPDPIWEFGRPPIGAMRAFLCRGTCQNTADKSLSSGRVIDNLLFGLGNLRKLDWCVECRPSELLSEDWKVGLLREELEMINRACPHLEHLGLLNFSDGRVSDALMAKSAVDRTANFLLDGHNAVSGIFPNLTDITFYVGENGAQAKILSAAVLGMTLRLWRKIRSTIVPWHREVGSQLLIIEDIGCLRRLQELMELQLNIEPDDFCMLWGKYLEGGIIMPLSISPHNVTELDLLSRLASRAAYLNLALDLGTPGIEISKITLPKTTMSLSIQTATNSLAEIKQLTSHLHLRSLAVKFTNTFQDDTDETVTMTLSRRRPQKSFRTDWSPEQIMAFNLAIWGDMVGRDYGDDLFEAVMGRAIARTTWEGRKYLETVTKALFDDSSCIIVEIIATYPMFGEELARPRLFTLK